MYATGHGSKIIELIFKYIFSKNKGLPPTTKGLCSPAVSLKVMKDCIYDNSDCTKYILGMGVAYLEFCYLG